MQECVCLCICCRTLQKSFVVNNVVDINYQQNNIKRQNCDVYENSMLSAVMNVIDFNYPQNNVKSQYLNAIEKVCNSDFDSAVQTMLLIYMFKGLGLSNIHCTQVRETGNFYEFKHSKSWFLKFV